MFEIQEGAKVITESMDPDAKVIFGTVHDEKLKKGDLKVTIIASGFPENATKKTLFGNSQKDDDSEQKEEKSGGIFGNNEKKVEVKRAEEKPTTERDPKVKAPSDDDDDDWGAVPAFLRRSKIK
jgi:cell division protein FtsZ